MKKVLIFSAMLSFCLFSTVQAHDGFLGTQQNPYELDGYDYVTGYVGIDHEDEDPWKGTFTLNVKNTSTQAWGDFHFGIWGAPNVFFGTDDGLYPTMNGNLMAGTANNYFEIVGAGTQLNLFFYDNAVNPGDTVEFVVYTDNTMSENVLFGIYFYPTPIPEPATMALMGLGGLALLRRKRS